MRSMNKQKILDNVKEYSAGQLVEYIQEGIVTFDEIVQDTDGEFDPPKRREVKRLLENGDSEEWRKVQQERTIDAVQRYLGKFANGQYRELARSLKKELVEEKKEDELKSEADNVWTTVDKTNLESLRSFIKSYPDSRYVNEANTLINNILLDEIMGVDVETLVNQIRQLQTQKGQIVQNQIADQEYIDNNTISTIERFFNEKKITKNDLLEKIQEDPNLLSAGVVKRLINSGTLSMSDLVGIGINRLFIQKCLMEKVLKAFQLLKNWIDSQTVYRDLFLGYSFFRKSCALGAILSVAASGRIAKSMDPDTGSQGYGYMTKLS